MIVAVIVVIAIVLILAVFFVIGDIKMIGDHEEIFRERGDAEQEEYLRQWREKQNKKKEK